MSDLLPMIPETPEALDFVANPGAMMVALVDQARALLEQAKGLDGIAVVLEAKSRAEAIRVYVQQKDIGKEAELSAAEIVRRAERRIGELIREGQAEGTIASPGQSGPPPAGTYTRFHYGQERTYEVKERDDGVAEHPVLVTTATGMVRSSLSETIYPLIDNVPAEAFEEAIAEAKAEGNLSRANLVRKIKKVPPPKGTRENPFLHKTRRIDSNRVIRELVGLAPQPTEVADFVDYSELDRDQIEGWIASLASSIKFLQAIKKNLTKEMTLDESYNDDRSEEG